MIKFSSTLDYNLDELPVRILQETPSLIKTAFVKHALKYSPTKGQTDIHVIALGDWEGYGQNRNGDAFPEEDCIKYAHTFKKANRAVHWHHKNKPNDPKYGNIKASEFNPEMKRIELIMGIDNDNPKNADALQKIANGEQVSVSMACKIPGDYCTWCDHFAPDEKSRCEHIPDQLGEMNKDGVKCGMVNKRPNWFEISMVGRPADYIGYSLNSSNTKLASDRRLQPLSTADYLQIYEGFVEPSLEEASTILVSKEASVKRTMLHKLAELEKQIEGIAKSDKPKHDFLARQTKHLNEAPDMDDESVDELRKHDVGKTMKAIADKGILLSPESFMKYVFGDRASDSATKGMKSKLKTVFRDMEDDGDDKAVNDEKFEPAGVGSMLPKGLRELVEKLTDGHSMFGEPSVKRVMSITIAIGGSKPKTVKKEEAKEETKEASEVDSILARTYATYKLAALNYLENQGKLDDILLYNALIQNRG